MELGGAGVTDASRLAAGQSQQLGHALRGLGQTFGIGKKRQLGHAPRRFQTLRGHRKIDQRGGLACGVHPLEVGQGLSERRRQQTLAFQGGKVFTIDPDQVHRAFGVLAPSLLFGAHALDHIGRIADLDVLQLDAQVALQLACGPLQVSVDALTARPGVEENGLAACGVQGVGPSGVGNLRRRRAHSHRSGPHRNRPPSSQGLPTIPPPLRCFGGARSLVCHVRHLVSGRVRWSCK